MVARPKTEAVPQNAYSGSSITVFAITRDGSGNFVANVAADAWTLINKTGGVVNGDLVVAGEDGTVNDDGFAVPPSSAPKVVKEVVAAGNEIAKTPYKWGGGHPRWDDTGYDCSGSVSFSLHAAGLLDSPLVSGEFARWGDRGRGRWITIYANAEHVYMVVAGMRFDTSARSRTGSRWTIEQRPSDGFAVTHPAGL